jgi:SAM-dependent methyltransferase
MKVKNPEKRLRKFLGKVDKKFIDLIKENIVGDIVLDVGCGMGTTTGEITKNAAIKCIGIDYDSDSLAVAKALNPNGTYLNENCEKLSFKDNYFDTIILRDVLHHLKGEADFNLVRKELIRVAKPNARLIILDPNVNFILKTARKIAFHKDEECTFEDAIKIVETMNGDIRHSSFNTVISIPLSGGYVGVPLVPNILFIQNFVMFFESILEKIVNKLNLGRILCWRYFIIADIKK